MNKIGNPCGSLPGETLEAEQKHEECKKVYIVGAHSRGQTLAKYLQYLDSEVVVEAYLYNNQEKNPEQLRGIPVICMDETEKIHTEYPVYIATRGVSHASLTEALQKIGFTKIYPVTVELDLRLRNDYLKKFFAEIGRDFRKIDQMERKLPKKDGSTDSEVKNFSTAGTTGSTAVIYVAKSIYDSALQQEYTLGSYEREIQVGAALTEKRLYPGILTDDVGDNISERNQQFCELTALYWIWKHAKEDYVGLVHYRRHFMMPENWAERMCENEIDVILPIPLYVAPSLEGNYRSRHDPDEWDVMLRYLKQRDEKEYQEAKTFFQTSLYSPCNMFVMKREILDELCTWLFPVLFAVAEYSGQKEVRYSNRYPGFISERLLTFFFEKNRERFKVVYADKNFLA